MTRVHALALAASLLTACAAPTTGAAPLAPGASTHVGAATVLPDPPVPVPMPIPCSEGDVPGCERGCDAGLTEDCVTLGASLLEQGDEPARARALELFDRACDAGSARGCFRAAERLTALGRPREALERHHHACELGLNAACVAAGLALLEGGGDAKGVIDAAGAARLLDPACQRGNATACFELARLYLRGDGVLPDTARANALFDKACRLGHEAACLWAKRGTPAP